VQPKHVGAMPGDPPIYPIGCAGVITESHRLPDGRYNLVLLGEHRVRVVAEEPRIESRLYRVARVIRLHDAYPETERGRVARLRAAITSDVAILVRHAQPDRSHAFDPELFAGVDDETFVNAVANAFAFPAEQKQGMLEAEDVPERYARLASALSFQRLDLETAAGGSGRRFH